MKNRVVGLSNLKQRGFFAISCVFPIIILGLLIITGYNVVIEYKSLFVILYWSYLLVCANYTYVSFNLIRNVYLRTFNFIIKEKFLYITFGACILGKFSWIHVNKITFGEHCMYGIPANIELRYTLAELPKAKRYLEACGSTVLGDKNYIQTHIVTIYLDDCKNIKGTNEYTSKKQEKLIYLYENSKKLDLKKPRKIKTYSVSALSLQNLFLYLLCILPYIFLI